MEKFGDIEIRVEPLRLIKANPEISAEQLAQIMGISSGVIEKHIAKFKKQGILIRIDPDKGGY